MNVVRHGSYCGLCSARQGCRTQRTPSSLCGNPDKCWRRRLVGNSKLARYAHVLHRATCRHTGFGDIRPFNICLLTVNNYIDYRIGRAVHLSRLSSLKLQKMMALSAERSISTTQDACLASRAASQQKSARRAGSVREWLRCMHGWHSHSFPVMRELLSGCALL